MSKKHKLETEAQRKGRLNRDRGIRAERTLINKLKCLGFTNIKSSRAESRNLDAAGIDIADPNNELPVYVQCKCTTSNPQYAKIISECPLKDKPVVVYHNKQYKDKESDKQFSGGTYMIIPGDFALKLLQLYAIENGFITKPNDLENKSTKSNNIEEVDEKQ